MFLKSMSFFLFAATVIGARAETHTVHFVNNCGFGTPTLTQRTADLSTGGDVTFDGPVINAIAYLQTGSCGFNGEGCTVIETNLTNPGDFMGSESCTEVSPGQSVTVTSGFAYFGGDTGICNGLGTGCTNPISPDCGPISLQPIGSNLPVCCQDNNVNLAITFCN